MFKEIIEKVLLHHDDFEYEEIYEMCQDFYDTIPKKIKEETKIKRTKKYITKEFELDNYKNYSEKHIYEVRKEYSLETIPKYLFE